MEDFLKWAATAEGLSVQGLLFVNLIVVLIALHRKWMVPGWVHNDVVKERDALRALEVSRNESDKAHMQSLEVQVKDLTDALKKRQTRRQSQRGGQ